LISSPRIKGGKSRYPEQHAPSSIKKESDSISIAFKFTPSPKVSPPPIVPTNSRHRALIVSLWAERKAPVLPVISEEVEAGAAEFQNSDAFKNVRWAAQTQESQGPPMSVPQAKTPISECNLKPVIYTDSNYAPPPGQVRHKLLISPSQYVLHSARITSCHVHKIKPV
jgi:hypothetical protein